MAAPRARGMRLEALALGVLALPTAPSPAALTQAFHIVYGALAAFVAAGAWMASRVPAVQLEPGMKAGPAGE